MNSVFVRADRWYVCTLIFYLFVFVEYMFPLLFVFFLLFFAGVDSYGQWLFLAKIGQCIGGFESGLLFVWALSSPTLLRRKTRRFRVSVWAVLRVMP